MTRTSAVTLIQNQCDSQINAFLFIQILDFPATGGLSNDREEKDFLLSIIFRDLC